MGGKCMSKMLELLKMEYEPVAIYRGEDIPEGATVQTDGFCSVPPLLFSVVKTGNKAAAKKDMLRCPNAKVGYGFCGQENIDGSALFLSCGIEGQMPGTKKKKSPHHAKAYLEGIKSYENDDVIIFAPISKALAENAPIEVVIFYAAPNHLSALCTLVSYDSETAEAGTIMPYSAGCQSIYQMAKVEGERDNPRAILGMTDFTPRQFADSDKLTFAVPYKLYQRMEENSEGSFLEGKEWQSLVK
jgi:hypothetical protein